MRKLDRPSRLRMLVRRQRRLGRLAIVALPVVGLAAFGLLAFRGAVEQAGVGSWFRHEIGLAVRLRRIDVTGGRLTTPAEVRTALGLKVGDPIMSISIEQAERDVETLPFVETAVVERRLPGTLVVHLVERTPFAVWQNQGRFVLIDRTGKVVQQQALDGKDAEAFARLPLVVGEGAPDAAAAMIDALDTEPAVRDQVVAMIRVGGRRWNLQLRDGCDVMLPEAHAQAAVTRLASLEHAHQLLERPLVAIDMRLPDRLVLRAKETEPAAADATGGSHDAAPDDDATRRPT